MAICVECEESFSDERLSLGYNTCLDCGDASAKKETYLKSKRVAILCNKGAYQYIGSVEDIKSIGK